MKGGWDSPQNAINKGQAAVGMAPPLPSPSLEKTLTKFEILLKLVGPRMIMNVGCDA